MEPTKKIRVHFTIQRPLFFRPLVAMHIRGCTVVITNFPAPFLYYSCVFQCNPCSVVDHVQESATCCPAVSGTLKKYIPMRKR